MIAPRPEVAAMPPYVPGRSIETVAHETGRADLLKLASNESLWGPSERAISAAREALAEVYRYPEVHWEPLLQALGRVHGLPADHLVVGNGADELLRILAAAYLGPGDHVIVPQPSFSQYAFVATLAGATVMAVAVDSNGAMDVEAMAAAVTPATRMLFLCSPNNPTGGIIRQAAWQWLLEALPEHILIVVDQAYGEFITDPDAARIGETIAQGFPVAMVRTLSKAYGLAGLRVGWMAANASITNILRRVRDPFSVNLVALKAALAAVSDQRYLRQVVDETVMGRIELEHALTRRSLRYFPSQANFLTFDCGQDAHACARGFESHGVIVRPCNSFGLNTYLRVTVGPRSTRERFLTALDQVREDMAW